MAINSDLASILALQGDIDAALVRYKECEAIAAEKHTYLQPAIRVNTGSLYLQVIFLMDLNMNMRIFMLFTALDKLKLIVIFVSCSCASPE